MGVHRGPRRFVPLRRARTLPLTPQGYSGPDRRVRLATAASVTPMSWRWLVAVLVTGMAGALAVDQLAAYVAPQAATVLAALTLCLFCSLLTAAACSELVVWKLSGRAAHAHRLSAYALLGLTCGAQLGAVLGLHFGQPLEVLAGGAAVAIGGAAAVALTRAVHCVDVDTGVRPLRLSIVTAGAALLAVLGGIGAMVLAGLGDIALLRAAATAVLSVGWALVALRAAIRTSAGDDAIVPCVATTLLSLAVGMSAFSFSRGLVMATVVEGAAVVLMSSHALLTLRAVLWEEQAERRELVGINREAELAVTEVRYRLHDVVSGLAGLRTDAAVRALVQPGLPLPEVVPSEGLDAVEPCLWEHEFDALLEIASRKATRRASVSLMSEIAPLVAKARRRGQDVRLSGADLLAVAVPGSVAAVLGILLDNAARHTRSASVAIVVSRAWALDNSPEVEVRVLDDGPGVGEFRAGSLFVPGVGGADGGQGLGLASARRRAQASGGDLYLDTPDGGGACFVLRLPADEGSTRPPLVPVGEGSLA